MSPQAFLFTHGPPTGNANLECLNELLGHMSVELRCEGFQKASVMFFQTCVVLSSLKIAKVTSAVEPQRFSFWSLDNRWVPGYCTCVFWVSRRDVRGKERKGWHGLRWWMVYGLRRE